jgi:nucleoside-diphosphate-sugar epimerase
VVSRPTHLPSDETEIYSPGDVYQASKVEAEKIALNFFAEGKIRGMVLRPAMIYGPHDHRLLKLFKLVGERRFVYIGNGNKHVHFIDVRDLAKAFILAMNHIEINGEVVLIAGERPFKLKEVIKEIAQCYEVPVPKVKIPVMPIQMLGSICEILCAPFGITPPIYRRRVDFFVKERCFSTKKAEKLLNFKPMRTTFQEIKELCLWYEKEGFVTPKRVRTI